MRTKKVLFLTYFFPPSGGAGVGRNLKFAKYLPKFDWQPIIISAGENINYLKDYNLLKDIAKDLIVHRIDHKEINKERLYICRKLKIDINFPDYYKHWHGPTIKKAREIIKKEKIDLIFSSSAPFTSHFIALELKKEFKIPWVADFRDPWYGNNQLDLHRDKFLLYPINKIISAKIKNKEKKFVTFADRIIVTSWFHKNDLFKTHKIASNSIEVITNGYDEEDFSETKENRLYSNKLTIIFTGSFYTGFKEIFNKFLNVVKKIDNDIEVIVVGKAAEEAKNIKTTNLTCIYNLSKNKLFTLCKGSDFLFLMTLVDAKWWIPGKIFEYFRLNKPVIALTSEFGDAARLTREAQAGFVISHDEKEMEKQLRDIFKKYKNGEFNNFKNNDRYIKRFERRILTKKLAHIFNNVLK